MNQQPSQHPATASLPMGTAKNGRGNDVHLDALLHSYLLQVQGGRLHSEHIAVNAMQSVLDLGCGTGEWIFDLAKRYPKLRIYGIDSDEGVLRQAKVRRNTSSLRQVELRQMNLLQGLPIPDAYIDFVHMRSFACYVKPEVWPFILQECVRVLRPQGWLSIVELELCEISSPACLALHRAMLQARARIGRSLDVTGRTLGVAQRLYGMLLQAGLYDVGYDVFTVDIGAMSGNVAYHFLSEIVSRAFIVKPLVVQQGIVENAVFDALVEQAQVELQAPDLCGWAVLISAYGCYGGGDE